MPKVVINHDSLYDVNLEVRVNRISNRKQITDPTMRVAKQLTGKSKVNPKKGVELIGSKSEKAKTLKSINDHHGQNILITISSSGETKSSLPPRTRYVPVPKKRFPSIKLIVTKVTEHKFDLPPGKWKAFEQPRKEVKPLDTSVLAEHFNSRRNK